VTPVSGWPADHRCASVPKTSCRRRAIWGARHLLINRDAWRPTGVKCAGAAPVEAPRSCPGLAVRQGGQQGRTPSSRRAAQAPVRCPAASPPMSRADVSSKLNRETPSRPSARARAKNRLPQPCPGISRQLVRTPSSMASADVFVQARRDQALSVPQTSAPKAFGCAPTLIGSTVGPNRRSWMPMQSGRGTVSAARSAVGAGGAA